MSVIAATQNSLRKGTFLDEPTFDEIVFGEGDNELRYSFAQFRDLPLPRRVHLLLSKPPRFYRGGEQISGIEAMRFQSSP